MKTYTGRREYHLTIVTVNDRPLDPRLDLWEHSPTGFVGVRRQRAGAACAGTAGRSSRR